MTSAAAAGAAIVVVVAATLLLADGVHGDGAARTLVGPSAGAGRTAAANVTDSTMVIVSGAALATMIANLRPSLVELVSGRGRDLGTGVVLPEGDLVLTSATAVAGRSRIVAITASGRRLHGHVVGVDTDSGVAVVGVSRQLPPATFSDEEVTAGEFALAACMCSSPNAGPDTALAKVTDVGTTAARSGSHPLVDAIDAAAPLGSDAEGGVLLDADGEVIGILDARRSTRSTDLGVFVPASLATGTAEQLAAGHPVVHGWLGVAATDEDGGCGAVVVEVMPESPAFASGLSAGDVIDTVDGHPVCSLADLQGQLYVLAPDERVRLGVMTPSGSPATMLATLAAHLSTAG